MLCGLLVIDGQAVGRVGVDVWAEFVRSHFPFDRLADRDYPFRWRRVIGWRIKPLPNESLRDFGIGQDGADSIRHSDLSSGQLNYFY